MIALRHSLLIMLMSAPAQALAQRAPRVSYVYPAGGRAGTTVEVTFGGQYLDEPTGVITSDEGIEAKIIEHDKPPSQVAIGDIREKLREMQSKMRQQRNEGKLTPVEMLPTIRKLMREGELTEKDLRHLAESDRKRNDPKQQQNAQIAETVRVQIRINETTQPGIRYLRLQSADGLSNPLRFMIGQHLEVNEAEAPFSFDFEHYSGGSWKKTAASEIATPPVTPPVTINGRILPGEVDNYTFHARKDERLVVSVQARNLVPYLADAVPGWFQAIVALFDATGQEVAFADGYRFDPDPVLFFKIPAEGEYRLQVHDSIYRGREDFIYRITVGELPYLTGISPLGARTGEQVTVTYQGGNLGANFKERLSVPDKPGIINMHATNDIWRSNEIPFQIDTLPEEMERESNNRLSGANEIKAPMVINGNIDSPGDVDYYRVKGRGNRSMVFEIFARRLGSPMDAGLAVLDTEGRQLEFNDDHEDPTAGLTTHHADSRVLMKMPPLGECFVRVTDTQHQGGIGHAYRLRVSPGVPAFALRVTPSSVNVTAGGIARLTVHALRLNGFAGEIALKVKDAPGFVMKHAMVPAGKDVAEVSLSAPSSAATDAPIAVGVEGSAEVEGEPLVVEAVPAEDMMQAFIYRHLVPVDALLVDVRAALAKAAK